MFKWIKLFLIMLLFSFELSAQVPSEYTKLSQAEQYQEAINYLNSIDKSVLSQGKKAYLIGLAYSKLRRYDLAILEFNKAIKEKDYSIEVDYELGQALYANNNLKQARYHFSKSVGKKINEIASIYYVAYISELLEDTSTAKYNYGKLIKDKRTDKKMLQLALFQYAKITLNMLRIEEESMKTVKRNLIRLDINLTIYIPRYVLPLLVKAQDVDPSSEVGGQVDILIRELVEEFKLDPNTLVNGRKISPYRLYVNLAQRLKYDDNVNLSKKASTIYETEGYAKYDFVSKKKVIISPELRLTYTKFKDQNTPTVYMNDSLSQSIALRNKFEHTLSGEPASFLLDAEYSTVYKDWRVEHKQKYFSKTLSAGIGEQFSLFSSGETTFRIKNTGYSDKTELTKYQILSLSAEQFVFLNQGQHLLIATLDLSQLNFYINKKLSSNAYLARMIYLIFEIRPTYTLQMILSASLTDTKAQKDLRGYEFTFNPSVNISKAFTDKLRFAINYNFTSNSSKQAESKYQKQVVASELSYTF